MTLSLVHCSTLSYLLFGRRYSKKHGAGAVEPISGASTKVYVTLSPLIFHPQPIMNIPSEYIDEKPIDEKHEHSTVEVSVKEVDTAAELAFAKQDRTLDPAEALRVRLAAGRSSRYLLRFYRCQTQNRLSHPPFDV